MQVVDPELILGFGGSLCRQEKAYELVHKMAKFF